MRTHRRKWGWWLVLAIAVAVAASLLYRRCSTVPGGQPGASTPVSEADTAPVVRDTVYVDVDGEKIPVVRERKVETGERTGKVSGRTEAPESELELGEEEAPDEASASTPASAETVIAIPVSDITSIIRKKSGWDITVSTKAPDHIDISYAGKMDIPLLGEQDMDFTAGFKVVDVQGDSMVIQLDSGTALNLAADLVAPLVLDRLPAGLVESYSNGRAVINLQAIPQYSKRLSGYSLTGISVDESNIRFAAVQN
jgi:hypothetical protein